MADPPQWPFRPLGGQWLLALNKMYYTYVLLCLDETRKEFYVGSTEDLKNRFNQHRRGEVATTKSFDKLAVIYYEACVDKTDARKREIQLKTGFGRGYLKRRLETYFKH